MKRLLWPVRAAWDLIDFGIALSHFFVEVSGGGYDEPESYADLNAGNPLDRDSWLD